MNRIGNIEFDFRMQNESFARELYSRWDRFFAQSFESVADDILTKYDCNSELIYIERLDIDLGTIAEAAFDDQFPILLREKLEEAFIQWKIDNGEWTMSKDSLPTSIVQTSTEPKLSITDSQLSVLCYFLLHGSLPWYADPKYKDIAALFQEVIRTNGKKLKQFLQTYGHYTSLQERLVYQLNDPELEQGICLFSPSESVFILSYVKMLRAKYKSITKPEIPETTYRYTVWKVVYAYFLTNRSSYFNKKAFITQTLIRLASAMSVTYAYLLDLLTDELEVWMGTEVMPAGLLQILNELKKELTEESIQTMAIDPVKLYKTLEEMLRNDLTSLLNQPTREVLKDILSRPDTCRIFLQFLTEEEVIRLIPVVVPSESDFVILYAHALDRQNEQNRLAGKAGSEFRTLKWQVIFPLLFENRGSTLQRKYFVVSVLRKIASHYNLSLIELVNYFNLNQTSMGLDRELKEIFLQLYDELKVTERLPDSIPGDVTDMLEPSVQNQKEFTNQQQRELFEKLSDQSSRKKLFESITEKEQENLVRLLYKRESDFILSYASSLEKQEKTKWLEGKAGGGFRQLKWEFIWAVLIKSNQAGFNRRYFVEDVLRTLAGHHNLDYSELLGYFYTEDAYRLFPPDIQNILETLYMDEMKQLIQQSVSILSEKSKRILLTMLLQASKALPESFVMDYLQFLDACGKTGLLSHVPASEFHSIIWKQTVGLLFPLCRRNGLTKFQFVKQLLEQVARYYQLSFPGFLDSIHQQTTLLKSVPPEVHHIQNRLYNENRYYTDKLFNLKNEIMENVKDVYVNNAGVVLLSPWFPRLFTMLGLTESNKFKSKDDQIKAIYVIQYAIYEKTDFPEHELLLNKIMVGWDMGDAVPTKVELTDDEKKTTMSMVEGAKNNWPKLKNSSVESVKQAFLQREGKLEETDDIYKLTIQEKAYDMLLDTLPWNFRMTKYPWMGKRMEVKWR